MARSKEQIDQLKSLVDQLRSEGLSTDEIQAKVDEQKAKFDADQTTTVEVTDEIQTTPTEGKTNGAVAEGATATPVTGEAPESTELKSVDIFSESPDPKLRFIDFKINGKEVVLYENDYSKLAGQPIPSEYGPSYAGKNYPETFEEYAKLFKTPIQTIGEGIDLESGIKIEQLEEVILTGEATPKTKKAREIASGVLNTQAKITEENNSDLIVNGVFQPAIDIYNDFLKSVEVVRTFGNLTEQQQQAEINRLNSELDAELIKAIGEEYTKVFKNNNFSTANIDTDDLHANDIENQITKLRSQAADNYIRQQIKGTDIDPRNVEIEIGYQQQSFTEDIFGQTEVQNVINENRRVLREYEEDLGFLANRRPLEYDVPVTFNGKTYLVKTPPNLGEIEAKAVAKTSKILEQQAQDILKRQKAQEKKAQPYLDQIKEYDKRLSMFLDPENIPTQPGVDLYNSLIDKRNKAVINLNNAVSIEEQTKLVDDANAFSSELKQLEENAKNIGSTYIAGSALSKNYSKFDKLMATIDSQLIAPTVKVGAELGAAVIYPIDSEMSLNLSQASTDYFERISDFRQTEFPQDVTKVNGDLNADWTMKLTDMSINNAPTIATVLLPQAGVTLGVGSKLFMKGASKFARQKLMSQQRKKALNTSSALFFNMSAGSQLATQQIAVKDAPEELNKLKGALDNIQSNPDEYSYLDKKQILEQIDYYENVLDTEGYKRYLNAAAYGILEVGVERSLGTLRIFKNARQVSNTFKGKKLTNFQKQYRQSLKNLINIPGEVGEEFLVEGGNNLLDNIFLGENKSIFDGMNLELAENSAFSIVALRGPSNFKNIYNGIKNQLTSSQDKKKTKAKVEELFALEGDIQNNRDNPGTLKPAEIRAKRNRIYEIQNELRIDDFLSIQKWTGMTDAQKRQLIDLGGELAKAEAELFELAENPDYGVESFDEAYKAAEQKVLQIQKQQGELLKTEKYKAFEYTRDELKLFPPAIVEARSRVLQASRDLASIQNDGKVVSLTNPEAVEAFIEDNNLSEEEAEGFRNSNAAVFGGQIVLNESVIRNQVLFGSSDAALTSAISPLHELFHLEAKKQKIFTGKNLSEKLKIAVLGLEDIIDQKVELGSITEATANSIKNRIKQYKDDPSLTEKTRLEEVMAVFTESVLLGKIKKSDIPNMYGTKSFLNTAFSTLTGGKFKSIIDPFTTSNDLYEFISNFATKAAQVELQVGDVDEEDRAVKASRIYQEVETFKDDLINEQTKSSTAFLIADKLENEVDRRLKIDVDPEAKEDIVRNFLFDEKRGLLGLLQKYDPARNESIMGYLNSTTPGGKLLDARLIEFYENDPRYNQIIQSTTDEAVQRKAEQVFETEETAQAEELGRSKLIDVRENPIVKRVLPTLEKEIKLTEGDSSVEILNNNRSKFASEIYNIPEGKIEKVDNLTYSKNKPETSELGRIQQDFSNAQETERSIKTMPEFNVTTMESTITEQGERVPVSPEVRGRSMKIGQTVLDFFYEPYIDPASQSADPNIRAMAITNKSGRSKGKTTQTKVYRLKPEFRPNTQGKISPQAVSKAREWAGIDVDLNELSKNERRNYATKLAAWARMRGGQVALSVADKSLPESAPKQRRADTRAGRSRLVFSKKVDGALTQSQSQNIGKVFNKLNDQEKITFVQNIDPFFEAITKDDYNVETAFNNIFGPDFLKGKKKQDFINEWSKVRGSIVDLKNYNKGKPKKITVQDYLYQAFEEQTQEEVVENILGVKKGGVNFRSKDQLMGYVNFINSYIAKKAESLSDFELAEFVINDLGPTLSAGAKVGGNDFMWQRDAGTNLLTLVPSTLDRSKSIRTSLFGNQKEMAEVLIRPFISDQTKLTYDGNKPLWNGKPLLKKGYKVDQSVSTYLTSIKKNGEISPTLLQKSEEYAAKQVENIFDILDYYKSLPKDSEVTIDDLGMFFRAANGDMTAMVRAAANVDSFAGDGTGAYRYEHNPPARTMLVRMAEYVNGTITKQELKNEFDKYTVSIIPQQMDDVINERYKDTIPLVGSRYYNAFTYGKFPFAMNVYKKQNDGSYKKETIGEYQKEAYENQIKLTKVNNNKLGNIKFSKKVDNTEVLNRMNKLDNEAKEANKRLFDSADLDKGFNDILEQTTGIASEKRYKRVKAEVAGAARGRAIRGIPYSAQDLVGLLYETLGKGKLGDAQMAWWTENLLKPYAKAMNEIDAARLSMMQDYRALKKDLKVVPKDLRKKIPGEPFTREQAVRVYIWNKQGMKVPGISEADLKDLTDYVSSDTELQLFAEQLISIQKGDEYAKPKEGWPAGSITTDLLESINTVKRAKYLEQWKANKDIIFSEENMNKLEAAYGKKYRVALENMLERMESGRNRRFSDDSLTGRFTDWLQGSIGTIMFFNTRSALLQTISAMNFINFTDNNPLAAAKAFGNQKQFWSDFVKLINSDFLKARRSGLRMNVNEADIADMAKKGGPRAVINKLLQLGFAPTQIADSFAIASGGATFYRNRINTYKKQGLSQQEAETKAFEDFRENAEESQQSARPDRISMQQAGGLGRLILAFQNTPSQYARIIDKSIRDLKNGRGDAKTNISKIIYYSTVQNLLFNALQQALFAFAFDDEEPEDKEKEEKYISIANGMMDSLLRGTGVAGGVMSVLKNAILRIVKESEKARPNYEKVGADLLKIAPPVSSKLSKINQAARSYKWDKEEMKQKGWSLDNPAYLAGANVISALTNVPLDRGIKKANNVVNATDSDLETWERLALLGGWQDWEIGIDEETKTNKPQPRKTKPKSRKTKTRKTTTR
mgnify:CR=1 FL=1